MRPIALISDIHSNMEALNEVLADIDRRGVRDIYSLGDVVGYGPNPREVIKTLKRRGIPTLRGNHDEYVLGGVEHGSGRMNDYAQKSVDWTKPKLWPWDRQYLRKNPQEHVYLSERTLWLVHASPLDPLYQYIHTWKRTTSTGSDFTRVYSPQEIESGVIDADLDHLFEGSDAHALFVGHTHQPFRRQVGNRLVANVGSVGQPRDGDTRSAYCITDGTYDGTEIVRVAYPFEITQRKILDAGLPEINARRLELGR